MDNKDKLIESLIKEMQPRVTKIAMKHLYDTFVDSLLKMLLLMRRTPNQVETLINEIIEILGIHKDEPLKLFENLTDEEKEKFNLSEPLNEENYNALLNLVSIDILNNSIKLR